MLNSSLSTMGYLNGEKVMKIVLVIMLFLVVILEGKEYRVLKSEAIFSDVTVQTGIVEGVTLHRHIRTIKGYKNYYGSYDKYKVSTHPLHIVKVR